MIEVTIKFKKAGHKPLRIKLRMEVTEVLDRFAGLLRIRMAGSLGIVTHPTVHYRYLRHIQNHGIVSFAQRYEDAFWDYYWRYDIFNEVPSKGEPRKHERRKDD